jgi:hypothetical protein
MLTSFGITDRGIKYPQCNKKYLNLIHWHKDFSEKLTVTQLVKKITPYFSKVQFNITLPFTLGHPRWGNLFNLSTKIL